MEKSQSLPQMIRHRSPKRLSWGTVMLLLAVMASVSYKLGLIKKSEEYDLLQQQVAVLQQEVEHFREQNAHLQQQLATAQYHYQIQMEARKNLGDYLKSMEQHNAELTQNVNLYQSVSGKLPLNQGIEIKTFHVFPSQENTFRYLLVLSKQVASTEYITGAVAMTIFGHIDEKPIVLPVKYVDSARNDGLAFKFRYLQELSGELTLPEKFVAEKIALKVMPERGWPHFQRQFPWRMEASQAS